MSVQEVILVDENDQMVGTLEKMEAHVKGLLHRAFSVFVFNDKGAMLLQQRALDKYHCGGLWTNACCSHPLPGESNSQAAERRLQEELGFTTQVEEIFDFTYRAEFSNGLTEYEFDHVFVANYDGPMDLNPKEVKECSYLSLDEITDMLVTHPNRFTPWFHLAFPKVKDWYKNNSSQNN